MKEGSGQGWLVETRVILLLFLINLNRCALCASSVHQLSRLSQRSLSAFVLAVSLVTDHAPESPLRLSLNSRSTVAFIRSPRQLLQSDTGVPHFALDPLTYRCLLSLSPAADFAEPRPPRHIPPPPDSGREALRPAAPPPPIPGEEVGYSHLRPRPVDLNLKGCNARYQRVIRALVSFMRWSHCKGAWSEQRVNSRPRR